MFRLALAASLVVLSPRLRRRLSPDGRWIAYVTERALWVASRDGSNARVVATASSWISVGAFSPDSTRLSYARRVSRNLDVSEIVAIDGTGRVSLREVPVVGAVVWAPDSSSVVFVAQDDDGRYRPPQIHVASVDGTRVRRLHRPLRGERVRLDDAPPLAGRVDRPERVLLQHARTAF